MTPPDDTQAWKAPLQDAINSLIAGIKDASTLTVQTRSIKPGDSVAANIEESGKLVALTVIEIDGDTVNGLPMTDEPGGKINKELLDLHNASVDKALKYRAELLTGAQDLIKDLIAMLKS
jgi:hypothetical protein